MGFFDDVDLNTVDSKKKMGTAEQAGMDSENILDDLLVPDMDEENSDEEDMDEAFSEMPADYAEDVDDHEGSIENEPVCEPVKESVKEEQELPRKEQIANEPKVFPQESKTKMVEKSNAAVKSGHASMGHNVILEGTVISGSIKSNASIDVYGDIEGSVESKEDVFVGEQGSVKETVIAEGAVTISGTVENGVQAGNNLTFKNCKVRGDVSGKDIAFEETSIVIGDVKASGNISVTGAIKGNIDAKGNVTVKESAIIQGNIKSAVISIAPGAAIDGTCTQEYAKVKPADFFANIE